MVGTDRSSDGPHLLGHWPLRGDCRDHSGNSRHGANHGVQLDDGGFDGRGAHIEVPAHTGLSFGVDDFTLAAWVHTEDDLEDVRGDILCGLDPGARRGFTLGLGASAGGYSSMGDACHVHFGIDNGIVSSWEYCGRPSGTSNYVSNSLTVYDGSLYAAITDAERFEDWCHVFRHAGGEEWEDCGRVGDRKTHGVGPMVVHQGHLYAATWTYDWTRAGLQEPYDDYGCVYRYEGGAEWANVGQPGEARRLFALASYRGRLYVTAEGGCCYVWDGDDQWSVAGRFPNYAHPMGIHDGRLFAGVLNPAGVWAFDGALWEHVGNPQGSENRCNQIHALEVYRDRLHATTWPEGHVCALEPDGSWEDLGRLGESLEINALVVHNGKLYGGTIPYAEVFRCDGIGKWTRLHRFHEPEGGDFRSSNDWARVTSLAVYGGRLFASVGNCTSSVLDSPADYRGSVWSMGAGTSVTYGRDIGSGWRHIAAVKRGDRLELYVNGEPVATSTRFDAAAYDLSAAVPLRIGSGETGSFNGRLRDVRVYRGALRASAIATLAATRP